MDDLMNQLGLIFSLCVLVSEFCHDKGVFTAKAVSSKIRNVDAFPF